MPGAFTAILCFLLFPGGAIFLSADTLTQTNSWPSFGLPIPYSSIRRVEVDEAARAVNVVYEGEFAEREWSDELRPANVSKFVNELKKRVEGLTGKDLDVVNQPTGGLGFRRISG